MLIFMRYVAFSRVAIGVDTCLANIGVVDLQGIGFD